MRQDMIQTLEEALKKINELDQKNKQLEAELEKYKNSESKTKDGFKVRKKHDSAWMQSYNAFVVQYEKGKTIMEIVEQGDISRRTAYRYKAYYKKLKEKGMAVDKQD